MSDDLQTGDARLAQLEKVIETRRTNLRVDPERPIPDELVDRLVATMSWAPNHKRTWPWRVAILSGAGRNRLGNLVAEFERRAGADESKVAKARTKYNRTPLSLLVGCATHDDPARHVEDRDAVVAGIENVLLAATAAGLASHWATGAWLVDDAVKELAGVRPIDNLVALIYLGWPIGEVAPPARPPMVVTRINA